jgi:hypothetical protein
MGEKTLVDDTDTDSAFITRLIDIFYPIVSCRAVYLHAFLKGGAR